VAAIVGFALLLRSEQLARRFGLWAGRVAREGCGGLTDAAQRPSSGPM
jgi:hypothetical protein